MLYKSYLKLAFAVTKLDLLQEEGHTKKLFYGKETATEALKLTIRAALLSTLPVSHKTIIEMFYETALRKEEKKDVDKVCEVCVLDDNQCCCLHNFYATNRYLCLSNYI